MHIINLMTINNFIYATMQHIYLNKAAYLD